MTAFRGAGGRPSAPAEPSAPPAPYTRPGWRMLHPVARRLIGTRALRSVAQGALIADFVLYLRALHWSSAGIGLLLAASGIVGAGLSLAGGILSDRYGRRPFLLAYQAGTAAGSLAVLLSHSTWVLAAVAILLGYGRGANGAAGPFGPVEQAWLAQVTEPPRRGEVFSLNGAVGFWGMGAGSLAAAGVPLLHRWLPGPAAFESLFALMFVVALINYAQIAPLSPGRRADQADSTGPAVTDGSGSEVQRGDDGTPGYTAAAVEPHSAVAASRTSAGGADLRAAQDAVRRRENLRMLKLGSINAVNSLGVGLFSPLLPYWFAVRYGVGPEAVGALYAVTFFVTGIASIATGYLTTRIGLVRAVVWVRLAGVAALAALPFMATYAAAAALYLIRSVVNRGSAGARQAFGVSLVGDERRGLASSLNTLSMRLPSAAGPALGGWLLAVGELDLPFVLGAGLQLAYVILFGLAFRRFDELSGDDVSGPPFAGG